MTNDKKIFLVIGENATDDALAEGGFNYIILTPELEEKIANKIFIDLGGNAYPIAKATIQKLKEEIL